jgi:hypothetical protein
MSTNTVPAASPEILGRITQYLAGGQLEVLVQDTYDFPPGRGRQQWCGRRRFGLHRFIDVKGSSGSWRAPQTCPP